MLLNNPLARIGFGGGCHWCTEAVFAALKGVHNVEQGFIKAPAPNESYSEAVIVHYDPAQITLHDLSEIHLRTHASTSAHKMRGKYRSAIYVFDRKDKEVVLDILTKLQPDFDAPLVTQVLSFEGFKPSDERFQNYYEKHADGSFCQRYIDPKLDLLRKKYADFIVV